MGRKGLSSAALLRNYGLFSSFSDAHAHPRFCRSLVMERFFSFFLTVFLSFILFFFLNGREGVGARREGPLLKREKNTFTNYLSYLTFRGRLILRCKTQFGKERIKYCLTKFTIQNLKFEIQNSQFKIQTFRRRPTNSGKP